LPLTLPDLAIKIATTAIITKYTSTKIKLAVEKTLETTVIIGLQSFHDRKYLDLLPTDVESIATTITTITKELFTFGHIRAPEEAKMLILEEIKP
jgi:hypothetical protein